MSSQEQQMRQKIEKIRALLGRLEVELKEARAILRGEKS